jgi:YfiH family protein
VIHSIHRLRVPEWERIPQLLHGFFGRRGGQSRGEFGGLNLSFAVGDDANCVRENWRRVADSVEGSPRFLTMRQCHGAEVAWVDGNTAEAPQADALVSRSPGLALCVLTADCVPLLLAAPDHRVAAAVHAGWRGTVLGIVRRAVKSLEEQFGVPPTALRAALGPAIGACCYEVGRDLADELERQWGAMPEAVVRYGDKSRLDLRRINAALLTGVGVPAHQIASVGPCTRCAQEEYFSHRAACGAGLPGGTGRQLSFIGWSADCSS